MINSFLLSLSATQLRDKYAEEFSELVALAINSFDGNAFVESLRSYLMAELESRILNNDKTDAIEHVLLMLKYENKNVYELSKGSEGKIQTFSYLWSFLISEDLKNRSLDLYIDLYFSFMRIKKPKEVINDAGHLKKEMSRWPTGLDKEVIETRNIRKGKIIDLLIKKIEKKSAFSSKYYFSEGLSDEGKRKLVYHWWNESRFHLAMAVKKPLDLNLYLDNSLSAETMSLLMEAKKKNMPFFVTPYYLSLLNIEKKGFDDATIRSYILYSQELVETYGSIRAWEKEDEVIPGEPNAAGWLLPEEHNIHRRYPEVAILIPDSMGRACGGLCASCQRMYDFQSEHLNFNFESLKPKECWDKKLYRLMNYFQEDSQLCDILITGGDAFMSQNKTLKRILEAVLRMAKRKIKDNLERSDGEKYAEICRVRLGSRLPVYLPMRMDDELIAILKDFREKGEAVGIKQFIVQTHFQSPLEVTPEALKAIKSILSAGWIITNQLVFTVAASRKGHTAKLRKTLNSVGVICYYTFTVKGFNENYAMFTPGSRSMQEMHEEKVFGEVPKDLESALSAIILQKKDFSKDLRRFLKDNNLPFAATDRSVLNLPGIGKSMTFSTVGISSKGKRILKFEHDSGRKHSPIIDKMGEVYIIENKSIAAYLRQLKEMGESLEEYASIWNYVSGITEPRFSVYEYPKFDFSVTDKMTNLQLRG